MIFLRKLWPLILGGIGFLALLLVGRRNGRLEEKVGRHEQSQKAKQSGQARVQDGRGSGLSDTDRVRRNDRHWSGM